MADMTHEPKRGGRRLHHALTAKGVQTVSAPGRYFDGHGLYLLVEPTGAKRWKQRLAVHGKRRELGLGGYPLVTLAMAREAALANRRKVHAGGDPLAEKRTRRGVPTFAEAARKVFALRRGGWRNAKHAGQWLTTLEQFVFPRFGARGVNEITSNDVIAVLSPIWHAKPTTAKRVRQRIGAVLTWAVAQGLRPDNPADAVKAVLPKHNGNGAKAHRALPYSEYVERYGAPDDVVDVELGHGAFPSGYYVEAACPVCRPGAVADGALEGGPVSAPATYLETRRIAKSLGFAITLLVGAGTLAGCAGPVTHVPAPSAQSVSEMQAAYRTFDVSRNGRSRADGSRPSRR